MTKNLVILGSTGSIGQQTLEVVDQNPGSFTIRALTAHSNVELLIKQYHKYKPEYIGLADESKAEQLKEPDSYKKKTKLLQFASSRGFEPNIILKLLEN